MMKDESSKSRSWYEEFERMLFAKWLFEPEYAKYRRRATISYFSTFLAIGILLIFSMIELSFQHNDLALADIATATALTIIIAYLRFTKGPDNYALQAGVTVFGCFCIYLLFSGAGSEPYLWSYTFPLVALFLLGTRRGTIAAILFLLTVTIILIFDEYVPYVDHLHSSVKFHFVPSLLTVAGLSFLFEESRRGANRRMRLAVIELSKSKEEIEQQIKDRTADLFHVNEKLLQEIRERKLTEDSLRASEEKFRSVVESSFIGIFFVDDAFKFTDANDELCRILGYPREEIIGHDFRQFLSDESRNLVADRYIRRQRGEDLPHRYEINIIRKDGEQRRAELIPTVIKYSSGNIMTVGQLSDITARKRAEEALQRSEAKYRTIIENMEEGYIEVDLTGRLTFFNEAARKFLGYSNEETMGMHYKRYTDMDNSQKVFNLFNEVYQTNIPRKWFEWEVMVKDGTNRTVEGSASLIADAKGNSIGFRGLFRDVTERKQIHEEREQLRERLYRAEKMEALGTLAGGVAHDLNNVLGILVGYSELLLQSLSLDNPLRQYAMQLLKGGERAAAIIQDMMTLTRRSVMVSEVVNLNMVISEFMQTPEFEAIENHHPGVKFTSSLDAELLNIKGSPIHLIKTVMNLVSNAAEAIDGLGDVLITTENHYVDKPIQGYDSTREGEYAVLTVSDTGSGISSEDIGRIFEPFYTKKVMGRSGTGLGLAVVWGTVKDHRGYIDVQSEEGKGTVFTLYFPITREAKTTVEEVIPKSTYMGHGEHILVVDDVEGQRLLASAMLKDLGYKVDSVASGEEAIEFVQKQSVDLIVLDMIMDPGIDGLETYRRILEIRNDQKALIVSGFAMTERVSKTQELGAGAYVKKPYLFEKLGLAVRKELDRR